MGDRQCIFQYSRRVDCFGSRIDPSHPYNKLADDIFLQKVRIVDNGNLTYAGLFFLGSNDAIQRTVPDFRIDSWRFPVQAIAIHPYGIPTG
ncbi:MAG TPA: hypothetical protein VN040_02975 [Pseudosphingobacterium sp.]|nr:hypothetical protein [Pseudosphingobacterium sp.]